MHGAQHSALSVQQVSGEFVVRFFRLAKHSKRAKFKFKQASLQARTGLLIEKPTGAALVACLFVRFVLLSGVKREKELDGALLAHMLLLIDLLSLVSVAWARRSQMGKAAIVLDWLKARDAKGAR